MAQERLALSFADGPLFLTDGGLETTLVFHEGWDLPAFAAFPLLDREDGRHWLRTYFARYLQVAADTGFGFVLDTPTWRANPDWGPELGYDREALRRINADAVALAQEIRAEWRHRVSPILVSGAIGPRGDGYKAGRLTSEEAEEYHRLQVHAFGEAGADMATAYTLSTANEAVGIARAASAIGLPVVISFTVETNGCLASGEALGDAIQEVDKRTQVTPVHYMVNCAHPSHFAHLLQGKPVWAERIGGIRANASTMSHAELDNAETLDAGDPEDLAERYRDLRKLLPQLVELGGCCGTDHRHAKAIAEACRTA